MSSAYSRMVLSDENLPLPAVYMMDLHNKRNGTRQTPEVSAWAPECVAECAFPSSGPIKAVCSTQCHPHHCPVLSQATSPKHHIHTDLRVHSSLSL